MTAEGTACNGAGEAPKAEFSPEKAAPASPGARAPAERDGEDLGGPFVIVNGGDSDGHSDRGSDLGKAPDEDSPSEEDDAPGPNAAPDAAAPVDVQVAGAPLGASSAEGRDRAADESEAGADDGEGEPSSDSVGEVVQQEAAGGEQGGEDDLAASGSDRAATGVESEAPVVDGADSEQPVVDGADSELPAVDGGDSESPVVDGADPQAHLVDSEVVVDSDVDDKVGADESAVTDVGDKVGARDVSAATDVAELPVREAASAEQDGEDDAPESRGHDDVPTPIESGSAAMDSGVYGEDSKEEQRAADVPETVDLGTGAENAFVENESFEAATEHESHASESKQEQNAAEVEKPSTCGEQDGMDLLQTNGHGADSGIVASDSEIHAIEVKGQETDQQEEGAPRTETEVLEKVPEAAGRNCADNIDERGETVDANGHSNAECSADASTESEAVIQQVQGEATCGILQLEEKMAEDDDEGSCDDCTAAVASSNEEVEHPMDGVKEALPDVDELEEVTEDTSQEVMLVNGLAKDAICVATFDETTSVPDLAADNVVEGNTAACEIEETEVKEPTLTDESNSTLLPSQQNCESDMEAVEHEKLQATSAGEANETENDVEVAELKKEGDMEYEKLEALDVGQANQIENDVQVSEQKKQVEIDSVIENDVEITEPNEEVETDAVNVIPLQEAATSSASVLHNEPRTIDLVDTDNSKHSTLATELESCDHVHTVESRSQAISNVNVDQLVFGALDNGAMVAGGAELTSETDTVDQGEPVGLNVDEIAVVDDSPLAAEYESPELDKAGDISKKDESIEIVGDSMSHENQSEICNISTKSDGPSSRVGNESSSQINEVVFVTDEACNGICSENVNASAKPSDEVGTKCLEALDTSSVNTVVPAEKDNDEHASNELHADHAQVIGPQRIYIVKVPRFAREDLWAKTQAAQAHLDQMTQERDAINLRKQKQKALCDEYREKLEAARREEREARIAHGDKKNDLISARSVIGKLSQANSIEEIDGLIATKERIMQHETISLKEEKLLIKEINDLKAQRKQLSASMGSKAEINEAFDQKDHIHERHKTLKRDSDVLLSNLKSLEENTKKIQKSFDDERTVLRKLNEEYRAANEIRQKAYRDWSELKAEPFKRNKHFFMYKEDRAIAENYKMSGDIYGLQLFCNNQIEKVMEIWNKNDDFRKQYVEANKFSTLRRLGTHDGRKLGPDEDPPVIPSRRPINQSSLTASSPEVPTLTSVAAPVLAAPASVPAKEDSFPVLPPPQISKRAKSKASGSSVKSEEIAVAVLEKEDVKQAEKEKARLMEEELELARKAEELARKEEEFRKEREAAEKERLRLEQKAKAKEAEERKKRKAEKERERAEFKARKEAEMKEKKKAKKDKKKGGTPADTSAIGDSNVAAISSADTDSNASDNPREVEVPQTTAPKRLSRPAAAIKQLNRVQPMPAPLRNRGRRKMRQYILIAAAVLSVLALFMAGNYIPRMKSIHF